MVAGGWWAAALVTGAVLAFDPGGSAPFGPAKALVVPVTVFGLLAAHGRLRVHRPSAIAWAAFLTWALVATALALDGWPAWVGTYERRFGFATWVLAAAAFVAGQQLDPDGRRRVVQAAALAAGVSGVVVLLELAGVRAVDLVGAGDRPVGTMGSSAFLGAAMALAVPVAAVGAGSARGRARAALAGGAALGAVALVASGARAAWVGVLVAGALVLWRRRPRPALVVATAVALVGLAAVTGVSGRVPDALTTDRGGVGGRLDEWRVALAVIADHPVTGAGPEGYRIAFGRAVDDDYEQTHGRDPVPDRAHSAPLDVAATTGLPGLALLAALVVVVARAHGREELPLVAGVVGYGAQSLFLFPLAELDPVAWLLAGAALAAGGAAEVRLPRVLPVVAAAGFAVAGVLGVVADRQARAGDPSAAADLRPDVVRYRLAEAAEHEAVGSSAGLDRAIASVDRARGVSPLDPAVRSEWTRLLLARAQRTGTPRHVRLARAALEDLADLDPRNAEVLLRLGVARALDGDDRAAERAWLDAERLAPRSAAASVDLALAYERQGRAGEAAVQAERALARDPGNPDATEVLRRLREPDGT